MTGIAEHLVSVTVSPTLLLSAKDPARLVHEHWAPEIGLQSTGCSLLAWLVSPSLLACSWLASSRSSTNKTLKAKKGLRDCLRGPTAGVTARMRKLAEPTCWALD